jgi:hypothetical protein
MGSPASSRGSFSRSGAGVRGRVPGRQRTRSDFWRRERWCDEKPVEFYGGWLRAFPDAHTDVSDVYFVDDIAVEEGTFSGTHDGALHTPSEDMPPTGGAISVPYIHVLRYRDGLHVALTLVFDWLLLLEQLGLVPAPRRRSDARTEGVS